MGGAGGAAVMADLGSTVSITCGVFKFGLGGNGGDGGDGGLGAPSFGGASIAGQDGPSGDNGYPGDDGFTFETGGGTIPLFGNFVDGPRVLTGQGSFTGTLMNETSAQTFTYEDYYGSIILANPSVAPEPSTWAMLGLGGAGLLGRALWQRRARRA